MLCIPPATTNVANGISALFKTLRRPLSSTIEARSRLASCQKTIKARLYPRNRMRCEAVSCLSTSEAVRKKSVAPSVAERNTATTISAMSRASQFDRALIVSPRIDNLLIEILVGYMLWHLPRHGIVPRTATTMSQRASRGSYYAVEEQ